MVFRPCNANGGSMGEVIFDTLTPFWVISHLFGRGASDQSAMSSAAMKPVIARCSLFCTVPEQFERCLLHEHGKSQRVGR
jgi:hypothetical protein